MALAAAPPVARRRRGAQAQEIVGRERTGRRVSEIKAELGATMDKYAAVFRDEAGLKEGLEIVRRLKEEAKTVAIDDKGTVFNQDLFGAVELGFMLDNAESSWSARSSARRAAAPSSAPTSPSATTRSGSSTSSSRVDGGEPEISYSTVTMTQWEPEERRY